MHFKLFNKKMDLNKIQTSDNKPLTLLIITSNDLIVNKVHLALLCETHVLHAKNSIEAVSIIRSNKVDVVVTEVSIGQVDGWKLTRLIRSGILTDNSTIPIILITENHSERIAETTAKTFDINRVISFQEIYSLSKVLKDVIAGQGCLNQKTKILVIEDTYDTAHIIERMLRHNYDIELAENGLIGLQKFKNKSYDIVLLDIMMPGMSGDEVLDSIMTISPNQTVITMTAHGNADLAELMLTKGASDYIQKPFKAEQLRAVCSIAEKREDFIIANEQFSAKTLALQEEQEKFESLSKVHYRILNSLNSIVIELTVEGNISFLNSAWHKTTGFSISESKGKSFSEFIHNSSEHIKSFLRETYQELLLGQRDKETIEFTLKTAKNSFFWCELTLSSYYDEFNQLLGISGTIDDISIRKKAEEKLQHVAFHDTLTGIHNRFYFDDVLVKVTQTAARTNIFHSLLYVDLDHFKIINDSQGHQQGDLVLKEISRLLSERVRGSDYLCRIGGDEFAIILQNTNILEAQTLASQICKTIKEASFRFGDKVYKVSCSIGISAIDGKAISSDIYLQQADIAMFVAKDNGRNRVHTFTHDDELTDEIKQSFEWAQKLQKALSEDNITLHFQPIIDVKTRKTECYEALVRLIVDDALVYPDKFIPYLEKAGDMNILDRHVIGKAFQLMHDNNILEKVAINLSAQAFNDDRLVLYIEKKLTHYNIEPSRIIFELTESASLSNITGTQRLVNRLNELGCSFSIDDFGTGFSTFAYLKQIPAESVKIDGSFVKDMLKDSTDAALVKAINETAKALNKKTIAEFVEDEATLHKLNELGIDYAQGYHIAKPMNIEEVYNSLLTKKPFSTEY